MRHGVKNKKLGVNSQHKRAILRALTTSIIGKGMEAEQSARYACARLSTRRRLFAPTWNA